MEKLNDGVSPGGEIVNALDIGTEADEAVIAESTPGEMPRSPLPWIGSLPRTGFGVMAVIDEQGYLVPLWTAGDLLRACKILWQAHS